MRRAILIAFLLIGCARPRGEATARAGAGAQAAKVERTTESGPIKATVAVEPAQPKLGDRIHLTLTVVAKPGVRFEMPAFGEALGRFAILSFVPRQESKPDGTTVATQQYELDTPMSGRNRVPALRIQYDGGSVDAGTAELLTEQLAVEVASVAPADAKLELAPLRDELPEVFTARTARWAVPVLVGALLLVGVPLGVRAYRRARARLARVSAFDVAMRRLDALLARGVPEGQDVDAFYVELSAIVRRYVEDRYAIRAPELTTEEFFREASRSLDLRRDHQDLLGSFLVECDRVKFAGHRPGASESQAASGVARRFLEETRLVAEPAVA
jgi:hypothetical protein